MTDSRNSAIALAKLGFKVFRTGSTTCRPIKPAYWESASADPALVEAEFTGFDGQSVEENVGIATGEGLLVMDIDVKDGKEGESSLAGLRREGLSTDTFTIKTPSGGLHLFYKVDPHAEFKTMVNWRPGVDTRAYHGYVSSLGTVKANGAYSILRDLPLADLDESLARSLLRGTRSKLDAVQISDAYEDAWSIGKAVEFLQTAEPETCDGNRHHPLIRIGHVLYDLGITPDTAAELVDEHWPFAIEMNEDVRYVLSTLAAGRAAEGKAWGSAHPRAQPSAYLELRRVHLARPEDENARRADATHRLVCAAQFEGKAIPDRRWLVPDVVPGLAVTMLSGDGGVGKSLLALQLGVAVATGGEWVGTRPEDGAVIYASAEDDIDEVHRRLNDIVKAQGLTFADLGALHILPLAGLDAVMGYPDKNGQITPTKLWASFCEMVERVRPALIVLDTLADVFGGDEVVRVQARQFVGQLRGLAIKCDLAVALLAHPSLSGMATGAGTSGSTAWSNSVRGRLYLTHPDKSKGRADPNLRVLTTKKANYAGGVGDERLLRWEAGRFRAIDAVRVESGVDELFLTLLAKFTKQGRTLAAMPSVSYAPKVFSQQPEADGADMCAFREAMDRLFTEEKIGLETYGPPSKRRQKIVIVDALPTGWKGLPTPFPT